MTYSTDTDLLYWEPNIAREAAFASQTLISGTGALDGTSFTIASGSFIDSQIAAGHIIALSGAIEGCFPILSVDSATQLTISTLVQRLPDGATPTASPIGTAASVQFAVRTFSPQREIVSDLLNASAGIGPGTIFPRGAVMNPVAMRRVCALGTLYMIYSALKPASADDDAFLKVRTDLYERLYQRALRSTKASLDLDGDGEADTQRQLGVIQLCRD
jgi:hypothetical protein